MGFTRLIYYDDTVYSVLSMVKLNSSPSFINSKESNLISYFVVQSIM